MSKEKFFTLRWNYAIAFMQGVPTFGFVLYAFSTDLWTTQMGLIVLSVMGALF